MAAVCTAVSAPGRLTLDGLVSCVTVVTLTLGTLTPTAAAAAVSWRCCATRGTIPIARTAATTPPAIPPPSHLIPRRRGAAGTGRDRESTRLNSSHLVISYAGFCLKKKKER